LSGSPVTEWPINEDSRLWVILPSFGLMYNTIQYNMWRYNSGCDTNQLFKFLGLLCNLPLPCGNGPGQYGSPECTPE
jgi:hypothetical protein